MRLTSQCAVVAVLALATEAASAESYDVTTLPFTNEVGVVLSNTGLVVGGILNPSGSISLGEWSNGVLTNLGAPSGLPSSFNIVQPVGMNNAGVIVGAVRTPAGGSPSVAFEFTGGAFTVLPLVNSTDLAGFAAGINNRGEIVGEDVNGSTHNAQAWLWSKGVYSILPVPGLDTSAIGITSNGTIFGNRATNCCTGETGYVLQGGAVQSLSGPVEAINNSGEAAGFLVPGGGAGPATIFKNGIATPILNVSSGAFGINSASDVVGDYQPAGFNAPRAFLWEPNSGALDVPPPNGFQFTVATGINNSGEIVGFGETTDGTFRNFLLTPDPHGELTTGDLLTSSLGVPEPDTGFLFGLGLAVAIVMRRSAARRSDLHVGTEAPLFSLS